MMELSYRRHRFPPAVIQHAVWLYLRFTLSYRDVEELLAERGLDISYETVRSWVLKFGRPSRGGYGSAAPARAIDGTWTRWLFGSPASGCVSGVPLTTKARSSTCWCSAAGTPERRGSSNLSGQSARRIKSKFRGIVATRAVQLLPFYAQQRRWPGWLRNPKFDPTREKRA
jgi:hypothetical protein